MSVVGKVDSLWRYPVKSMRGEELEEAFVGFSGVYGDRLFAFRSTAAPKGFPYLTGREQEEMLLYRPRFRHADRATKPPNLREAESLAPGLNPLFADAVDLAVDVETPSGEVLPVDDPDWQLAATWLREHTQRSQCCEQAQCAACDKQRTARIGKASLLSHRELLVSRSHPSHSFTKPPHHRCVKCNSP